MRQTLNFKNRDDVRTFELDFSGISSLTELHDVTLGIVGCSFVRGGVYDEYWVCIPTELEVVDVDNRVVSDTLETVQELIDKMLRSGDLVCEVDEVEDYE